MDLRGGKCADHCNIPRQRFTILLGPLTAKFMSASEVVDVSLQAPRRVVICSQFVTSMACFLEGCVHCTACSKQINRHKTAHADQPQICGIAVECGMPADSNLSDPPNCDNSERRSAAIATTAVVPAAARDESIHTNGQDSTNHRCCTGKHVRVPGDVPRTDTAQWRSQKYV